MAASVASATPRSFGGSERTQCGEGGVTANPNSPISTNTIRSVTSEGGQKGIGVEGTPFLFCLPPIVSAPDLPQNIPLCQISQTSLLNDSPLCAPEVHPPSFSTSPLSSSPRYATQNPISGNHQCTSFLFHPPRLARFLQYISTGLYWSWGHGAPVHEAENRPARCRGGGCASVLC